MKESTKEEWYAVRCVFQHPPRHDMTKRCLYEERITIWKAKSFEEAIEKAELEAKAYAEPDSKYLGLAQGYNLFGKALKSGAEVFSLMRDSNYSPKKYLDTYFDNGSERQGSIDCE
jgi:hypothetical protein